MRYILRCYLFWLLQGSAPKQSMEGLSVRTPSMRAGRAREAITEKAPNVQKPSMLNMLAPSSSGAAKVSAKNIEPLKRVAPTTRPPIPSTNPITGPEQVRKRVFLIPSFI